MSTAPPALDPLLTPRDIAARWGCKPARVIALVRAGKLRGINLGNGPTKGRFRVRPEDLDTYELSRAVQPPTPRPRRQPAPHGLEEFV